MASDLSVCDGSAYRHSSTDMVISDIDLQFFSDLFSPPPDSPIDILQALSDDSNQQNPLDQCQTLDQTAPTLLSCSPPHHQMQNLSLTHLQPLTDASNSANGFADFSSFEVKMEENHVAFESAINPSFLPHGYAATENAAKMIQRSLSSNSFDGKPSFFPQPRLDTLMKSPNFQVQFTSSPENSFPTGQMRRVCSTGDLQKAKTTPTTHRFSSSPLAAESSFVDEATFKVGRYSAAERKERIHRYRTKRTQRNFNKTIKYACRKTLADNRPRIRGRFARNDETVEIPKAMRLNRYEDEGELWIDGLHEEDDDGTVRGGPTFFNSFGQTQFQFYGSRY